MARRRVQVRGIDVADIRRLDPAASVTREDDVVTAVVGDSDALVRALVESGLPFADLAVRGATLEEAFLTLTEKTPETRKAA